MQQLRVIFSIQNIDFFDITDNMTNDVFENEIFDIIS